MAPVDSTSGKQISNVILNLSVFPDIVVVMVLTINLVFWWVHENPCSFSLFSFTWYKFGSDDLQALYTLLLKQNF